MTQNNNHSMHIQSNNQKPIRINSSVSFPFSFHFSPIWIGFFLVFETASRINSSSLFFSFSSSLFSFFFSFLSLLFSFFDSAFSFSIYFLFLSVESASCFSFGFSFLTERNRIRTVNWIPGRIDLPDCSFLSSFLFLISYLLLWMAHRFEMKRCRSGMNRR